MKRQTIPGALVWAVVWAVVASAASAQLDLAYLGKLTASDATNHQSFSGVAADGDTLMIGAGDPLDSQLSLVYLFGPDPDHPLGWAERGVLRPDDPTRARGFGAVKILRGDLAAISAHGDDSVATGAGSVHIFERDAGGAWRQRLWIVPTGEFDFLGARFGSALAMEGDTLVVGAPGAGSVFTRGHGVVYVYQRDGFGEFNLRQTIVNPDPREFDSFGQSLALVGDTLVIGRSEDWSGISGFGSAWVFQRDGAGQFDHVQTIRPNARPGRVGLAIALDETTLVLAADRYTVRGTNSGTAWVYQRDGAGMWTQRQQLFASDAAPYWHFGAGLDLIDGRLLVSAPGTFSKLIDGTANPPGAVYLFERGPGGAFVETSIITAPDGDPRDLFSGPVVLGDKLFISAPFDDDAAPPPQMDVCESGAVYVFQIQP
jgi:hypothetical protein